jgi:hypothetical protein
MGVLREALELLVDESRPIRERLDELILPNRNAKVSSFGKAILSPILQVAYPKKETTATSI